MFIPLNLLENEELSFLHLNNDLIETIPIQGHSNIDNSNESSFFSTSENLNLVQSLSLSPAFLNWLECYGETTQEQQSTINRKINDI